MKKIVSSIHTKECLLSPLKDVTPEHFGELCTIKAWRFNLAMLSNVVTIVLAILISESYWFNPVVYLFSVILIGSMMHGLSILVHETVHNLAYKSRKMNLYVGELLAWMVGITMSGYKVDHLLHHKKLNTDGDPDWIRNKNVFYEYPKSAAWNCFFAVLLLSTIIYFPVTYALNREFTRYKYDRRIDIGRFIFYTVVLMLSVTYGLWQELLLYWFIPGSTWFFFLLSYRGMAEHHGNLKYGHVYEGTRTVKARWWEKFFLAQHNIEYHLAHHLYRQVPFYNLPKLHNLLMQDPVYREKAHITDGYLNGLLKELTI